MFTHINAYAMFIQNESKTRVVAPRATLRLNPFATNVCDLYDTVPNESTTLIEIVIYSTNVLIEKPSVCKMLRLVSDDKFVADKVPYAICIAVFDRHRRRCR